jgi:hypothetical protein
MSERLIQRKDEELQVTIFKRSDQVTDQETDQVTPQAAPQVLGLLAICKGEMDRQQLQNALNCIRLHICKRTHYKMVAFPLNK